ncbi:MAG: DNA phosphorothioation-dependent restriction protein DptF [Sulfurovum sp.]|nr:DNA phosphorothioation-dependent restriction protein DptF [Sulfurovum sp.]
MSQLVNIVEKLSKSSPQAVFTTKKITDSGDGTIFDYLYIETEIEKYYKKVLSDYRESNAIVFLCGSSGDGKSAIIGQNQKFFEKYYDVHIDATHSFSPDQSAVEALDQVFDNFKNNSKSLVVGINIGILLNYAREGSDKHTDIKESINHYIKTNNSKGTTHFINFENYSKFEITDNSISSIFIHSLLNKVTMHSSLNPFYNAFNDDKNNDISKIEHINFQLLSQEAIKKTIVELLVTVHLKYDQFLTTRSLLDFIYTLIIGPELLVDQLFESNSNSIMKNISKEDPCSQRSAKLDSFILERVSNKSDQKLNEFIEQFNDIFVDNILSKANASLLIRIFYLYRNDQCASNYHHAFISDFYDNTTNDFINLLYEHKEYNKKQDKVLIRKFYTDLEKAVMSYANKQLPDLSKQDLITLSEINNYILCTEVEFNPDWNAIKKYEEHSLHLFPSFLNVNNQPIGKLSISLNTYKLIKAINEGYRPNKHDRNTIILFEELIEKIIDIAKETQKLVIIQGNDIYEFKNRDGEIEVKSHVR